MKKIAFIIAVSILASCSVSRSFNPATPSSITVENYTNKNVNYLIKSCLKVGVGIDSVKVYVYPISRSVTVKDMEVHAFVTPTSDGVIMFIPNDSQSVVDDIVIHECAHIYQMHVGMLKFTNDGRIVWMGNDATSYSTIIPPYEINAKLIEAKIRYNIYDGKGGKDKIKR